MKLVAAIPVKPLRDAKSRLADAVDARAGLAMEMLAHVLEALHDADRFARIAVVSPDRQVLALASSWGYGAVEQSHGRLNEACAQAARWAVAEGADGLLLAHGDLPHLRGEDVQRLVSLADRQRGRRIVMAPDRHGTGTNLLLALPPDALPFAFGVDSRRRHRALARDARVAVDEFVSMGTSADVDTAADLAESCVS